MREDVRITVSELETWTKGLLRGAGVPESDARTATEIFVRASMREIGHHDISYLPRRLKWIRDEGVNPHPVLRLVGGGSAAEVWDGDEGLGEVCCSHALKRATALAGLHGIGYAVVRRSNHFLAAAPYAELGAEAGCFVMIFSNTDPCMAAPGGTANVIGNDPMGFGVARSGGPNLIADMCMAYSSLGNLQAMIDDGRSIPAYWGRDAAGMPTTDPAEVLHGGSVRPMAEHKGFGLALMHELLTGGLADGATTNQVKAGGGVNTHNQAVIAFDLRWFGGAGAMANRVGNMAERLREVQPGIRLPGERSATAEANAREKGVPMSTETFEELQKWSKELRVSDSSLPELLRARV